MERQEEGGIGRKGNREKEKNGKKKEGKKWDRRNRQTRGDGGQGNEWKKEKLRYENMERTMEKKGGMKGIEMKDGKVGSRGEEREEGGKEEKSKREKGERRKGGRRERK